MRLCASALLTALSLLIFAGSRSSSFASALQTIAMSTSASAFPIAEDF
jgi:hypothetical protein